MMMQEKTQDRISELPDFLLHYILSLLPAKSATRTSLLSKRWKDLWKFNWVCATSLDFGKEFANSIPLREYPNVVNRFIQLHNGNKVEKLRLFLSGPLYLSNDADWLQLASDFDKWIDIAISRGVKELDLDFMNEIVSCIEVLDRHIPLVKLNHLIECESLTKLTLSNCRLVDSVAFNGFSSLVTICLAEVSITDDMFQNILSHCLLLENLKLREVHILHSVKLSSQNLRLKSLIMVCCAAYEIEILSPNLQSLHLYSGSIKTPLFNDVSSLVEAVVNFMDWGRRETPIDHIRVLSDLAHVKILTLFGSTLMYIANREKHRLEDLQITFPNLQELQLLMVSTSVECPEIIYTFFRHCIFPRLEKLFIQLSIACEQLMWSKCRRMPEKEPLDHVFFNLKTVKINNFTGHNDEMMLVASLLKRAVILETLLLVTPQNFYFSDDMDSSENDSDYQSGFNATSLEVLREELMLAPKESRDAQLVLCEYSEKNDYKLRPTHREIYRWY